MPGYIEQVLTKFQRSAPAIPQQTPYHVKPHRPFLPGHRQFVPTPDLSPKLDKSGITRVQSIIGSLLYYARAIDCNLLPALNTIASSQSSPTERTMQECHHLLDYVASHPHTIWFFPLIPTLLISSLPKPEVGLPVIFYLIHFHTSSMERFWLQ